MIWPFLFCLDELYWSWLFFLVLFELDWRLKIEKNSQRINKKPKTKSRKPSGWTTNAVIKIVFIEIRLGRSVGSVRLKINLYIDPKQNKESMVEMNFIIFKVYFYFYKILIILFNLNRWKMGDLEID